MARPHRPRVTWQHRHEATIAARAASIILELRSRGGMTVVQVADLHGMSVQGALRLLKSMSGRGGVPLYEDGGVWRLLDTHNN